MSFALNDVRAKMDRLFPVRFDRHFSISKCREYHNHIFRMIRISGPGIANCIYSLPRMELVRCTTDASGSPGNRLFVLMSDSVVPGTLSLAVPGRNAKIVIRLPT